MATNDTASSESNNHGGSGPEEHDSAIANNFVWGLSYVMASAFTLKAIEAWTSKRTKATPHKEEIPTINIVPSGCHVCDVKNQSKEKGSVAAATPMVISNNVPCSQILKLFQDCRREDRNDTAEFCRKYSLFLDKCSEKGSSISSSPSKFNGNNNSQESSLRIPSSMLIRSFTGCYKGDYEFDECQNFYAKLVENTSVQNATVSGQKSG